MSGLGNARQSGAIETSTGTTYFAVMRSRQNSWRSVIAAFVAAVFVIAVQPGSMAMPAPQTTCDHHGGHAKLPDGKNVPCKGMAMCLGMFACYGIAAVEAHVAVLPQADACRTIVSANEVASGLTHPPDNPPPIA
jgi:hypothetical protein